MAGSCDPAARATTLTARPPGLEWRRTPSGWLLRTGRAYDFSFQCTPSSTGSRWVRPLVGATPLAFSWPPAGAAESGGIAAVRSVRAAMQAVLNLSTGAMYMYHQEWRVNYSLICRVRGKPTRSDETYTMASTLPLPVSTRPPASPKLPSGLHRQLIGRGGREIQRRKRRGTNPQAFQSPDARSIATTPSDATAAGNGLNTWIHTPSCHLSVTVKYSRAALPLSAPAATTYHRGRAKSVEMARVECVPTGERTRRHEAGQCLYVLVMPVSSSRPSSFRLSLLRSVRWGSAATVKPGLCCSSAADTNNSSAN